MPNDEVVAQSLTLGSERAKRLIGRDAVVARAVSRGTLVVGGDSWFDYPAFQDIVEALESQHQYRIRSAAHFGDTAESMAYEDKQLDRVRRLLKDLRDSGDPQQVPSGVLLSCGGNDIVNAFAMILNHRASGLEALNADVVRGLLDIRLKAAIVSLVSSVLAFCNEYFPAATFPVLLHGYGHPFQTVEAFRSASGWWVLGSSRLSRFAVTSAPSRKQRRRLAPVPLSSRSSSTASNDNVLSPIAAHGAFTGRVKHVDLRPIFNNQVAGNAYRQTWRDEIHATQSAYSLAATAFHEQLL